MTTLEHRPGPLPSPIALNDMRAVDPGPDIEPGIGEMLARLHMMMRGRYLICSVLAILFAGGLGYAGHHLGEQTYRSTGQIRVVPTLPRIMYETEDKGVMPMFDSFVQTQVSLIRTQRVVEIALEDRNWSTPPPRDDASVARFTKQLNVLRDNELIAITFDSSDPVFAQTAVKSVITAYRRLYIEADGRENEQVQNQLMQRQATLNNELASNRSRVRAIAERYGTDNIDIFFKGKLELVQKLEQSLAEAKQQQTLIAAQAESPEAVDPETLASRDDTLARLMAEEERSRSDLRALRLGAAGARNPTVEKAERNLQIVSEAVKERVAKLSGREGSNKLLASVNKQVEQITEQINSERQQLKVLGQEQFQMADLQHEAEGITERLAQTKKRIEELTTEAPVSTGRITVLSEGDRPLAPSKDTRRVFAGAGALCGLMLPFGLALLYSSADRRYGAPVEARMSTITRDLILGALPTVDEDRFDAETSTLAAHCLHQVRTMLQIRCNGHAKAIAITSSRAGSGKTSVVLGLGVSYAISGSKTLLVDLDLVGGGLTRRAEIQARARLGSLLVEQGLVAPEQLEQALNFAKQKQIRLGEALVELGHLTAEQLAKILGEQKRSHAGLMNALYGDPLTDCVSSTGMVGLDILPLGSANAHDAATLSPNEIKSLIDEAKTMYDTVLIDTGPVPGSLEASMVASLSDGVILIVARGEPRANAESSIDHLRRIGGRVIGLVFNRAKPSDAGLVGGSMYGGAQSLRTSLQRQPTPAARQAASTRFGPVGQAVLDLVPNPPPAS